MHIPRILSKLSVQATSPEPAARPEETAPALTPNEAARPKIMLPAAPGAEREHRAAAHDVRAAGAEKSDARRGLDYVASALEAAADTMDRGAIRAALVEKYTTLRLLDDRGEWTVPELAPFADVLLPRELDAEEMKSFVRGMKKAAAQNPYLMKFFAAASGERFDVLAEKLVREGASVLPDVLIHAQMLDRLTGVLASDYRVSEACREHWKGFERDPKFWQQLNIFERTKLVSVNLGIDKYNQIHREAKVDPNTLKGILPLNILEAVTVDLYQAMVGPEAARPGHRANAYAGMVLAQHGPQGAGEATLSPDGKMVELRQKATKAWDDLYASWNMSFISVSGEWPYYMAKLAIPAVNDYAAKPLEYINKRALALHLAMINNAMESLAGRRKTLEWSDPAVRNLWGQVNAENARDYAARAAAETV